MPKRIARSFAERFHVGMQAVKPYSAPQEQTS